MTFTPGQIVTVSRSIGPFAAGNRGVICTTTDVDSYVRMGTDPDDNSSPGRWIENDSLSADLTSHEAPSSDSNDLEAFKRLVLQKAKEAQQRTGVQGVDEFLLSVGIDPNKYKMQRSVRVTLTVIVDDEGQPPEVLRSDVGAFVGALVAPFGGAVTDTRGGFAREY